MSLLIKIALILLSLFVFIFLIYKYEYLIITGLISSTLDQGDFFNPLFFSYVFFIGLAVGWIFFSNVFSLVGIQGKKKYFLIVLIVIIKILTPYYMFKNSVWLGESFCPTFTIHGFSSFIPESAPTGFLELAKSMKERCTLKNFIDVRHKNSKEQVYAEFTGYVDSRNEMTKENIPLFVITSLNLSYPYFGKDASVSAKIEAFTSAIEGVNSIFKKQSLKNTSDSTLFNSIISVSNNQITNAFNKTFSVYMRREFDLIRSAYLATSNKADLKVSFDFMKLRYGLLSENLGVSLDVK